MADLFGALVRTLVNTATIPVAVVKDAASLVETAIGEPLPPRSHTMAHLEKLKDEASTDG
ncbi:MAG: hypothetical protein KIS74_02985 [Burkholderiales bacterium]|nr:hypothetical protein [Burkholderiales bacterium]